MSSRPAAIRSITRPKAPAPEWPIEPTSAAPDTIRRSGSSARWCEPRPRRTTSAPAARPHRSLRRRRLRRSLRPTCRARGQPWAHGRSRRSGPDTRDVFAHGGGDARELVPRDDRNRDQPGIAHVPVRVALVGVNVQAADPARAHSDEHLVRAGLGLGQLPNRKLQVAQHHARIARDPPALVLRGRAVVLAGSSLGLDLQRPHGSHPPEPIACATWRRKFRPSSRSSTAIRSSWEWMRRAARSALIAFSGKKPYATVP